jgi:hypothetical protein
MPLPTLIDLSRRQDFDKKIAKIVEIAEPTNEALQDIPWKTCNQVDSHKTTIRTGYPAGTWRQLNYGVQPTVSTTRAVVDTTGMLEAYAEVDKKLVELNNNDAEWRLSEDRAHLIGMQKDFISTLFYGNTALTPERFMGFAPRFSIPSTSDEQSGYNMIDGGAVDGQTDCTSIWLVCWGENTVHGIVPAGQTAGWSMEDLGEETLFDANGGRFQGYRTHYQWNCGLTVRDWRYVVRICNIDSSTLLADYASGPKLWDLMTMASERIGDLNMGNCAFYTNRRTRSFLRRQIINKTAPSSLTWENIAGKKVVVFDGIPVRRVDGITNAETAILDAAGTFNDF